MASGPITSWQIDGETMEKWETLFPWAPESLQMMTAPWNKKMMLLGRKVMTNLDSILKSRDITLPTKVCLVKSMVFSVVRYGCELDHEGWMVKNGCFWTVVLEKILECALDCKDIQSVHPKENQSWIFIWRINAEAAILWPPDTKNWLIGKDPYAGKDWREDTGTTEDEMVVYHHQLDGQVW